MHLKGQLAAERGYLGCASAAPDADMNPPTVPKERKVLTPNYTNASLATLNRGLKFLIRHQPERPRSEDGSTWDEITCSCTLAKAPLASAVRQIELLSIKKHKRSQAQEGTPRASKSQLV